MKHGENRIERKKKVKKGANNYQDGRRGAVIIATPCNLEGQ